MAGGIEGKNPVILYAVDDQPQALFVLAQRAFAFGQQQTGFHQARAQLTNLVVFRRLRPQRLAEGQALRIALDILHARDNAFGQKQHRDDRAKQPANSGQPRGQ